MSRTCPNKYAGKKNTKYNEDVATRCHNQLPIFFQTWKLIGIDGFALWDMSLWAKSFIAQSSTETTRASGHMGEQMQFKAQRQHTPVLEHNKSTKIIQNPLHLPSFTIFYLQYMMNECNHGWMIWITAGIPMAEPALFAPGWPGWPGWPMVDRFMTWDMVNLHILRCYIML